MAQKKVSIVSASEVPPVDVSAPEIGGGVKASKQALGIGYQLSGTSALGSRTPALRGFVRAATKPDEADTASESKPAIDVSSVEPT